MVCLANLSATEPNAIAFKLVATCLVTPASCISDAWSKIRFNAGTPAGVNRKACASVIDAVITRELAATPGSHSVV
jgi:hypothetical protein